MKTEEDYQTEIDNYYKWMREAQLEGDRHSEDFFHSMALDAEEDLENIKAGHPPTPDILQMIRQRQGPTVGQSSSTVEQLKSAEQQKIEADFFTSFGNPDGLGYINWMIWVKSPEGTVAILKDPWKGEFTYKSPQRILKEIQQRIAEREGRQP